VCAYLTLVTGLTNGGDVMIAAVRGVMVMKTGVAVLAFSFVTAVLQGQAVPQQNARQALLEMFSGKPGAFEKHLPNVTRAALREAAGGGPSFIDQAALATSMMHAPGAHLETFEAGSTLLIYSDERSQSKFEVTLESDDLRGDEDQIQVSFRTYKEGQLQDMPVLPALTFVMKEEKGIWKLNELGLTVRVPLADPGFLKTVVAGMKERQGLTARTATSTYGTGSSGSFANAASAVASMKAIGTAEATYAVTYPNRGYTAPFQNWTVSAGTRPMNTRQC
jgi:hypothetical protein